IRSDLFPPAPAGRRRGPGPGGAPLALLLRGAAEGTRPARRLRARHVARRRTRTDVRVPGRAGGPFRASLRRRSGLRRTGPREAGADGRLRGGLREGMTASWNFSRRPFRDDRPAYAAMAILFLGGALLLVANV